MNILYLGSKNGTSEQRANALKRLGHDVLLVDPGDFITGVPLSGPWRRYLGAVGLVAKVRRGVMDVLKGSSFQLAWVDNGSLVSQALVEDLKSIATRVINLNIDDPFGNRDRNLWLQHRSAVSAYDLVAVVREQNVKEAEAFGAKRVLRVYMAADEEAHAYRELTEDEKSKWKSEVLFVGTAFPERGPFMRKLIQLGVPLSIYGDRWSKLREWKAIQHCWKGPALHDVYSYTAAIIAAKVCLGLLSKGNRDQHTTRSFEIPSLGGVLCAERTPEHLDLYKEDVEAVFWSSAEECAEKCRALLADEKWRRSVAMRGRERCLKNGWTNMKVAEMVIRAAFE